MESHLLENCKKGLHKKLTTSASELAASSWRRVMYNRNTQEEIFNREKKEKSFLHI